MKQGNGNKSRVKEIPLCNTRIENIDRIRKAYIMWQDIPVAELYHEYSSLSGEFDWVIKPIWDNWEKAKERGEYIDIAGIDDTLHKDEYIRRYDPEFVTQRTIPEGRKDLFPTLKRIGLTYNDLFEVLCRTHGKCGNDDLYVSRTPDKIIDVDHMGRDYDIPDFDTKSYGWISTI
jgi:hypothetical protein